MGMYTGLRLDCRLKEDKKEDWQEVLETMLKSERDEGVLAKWQHPLFQTERWYWMLNGTSCYLEPEFIPNSSLSGNHFRCQFNIKNYGNEIGHFLDWLSPYVESLNHGAYRYEEDESESRVVLEGDRLKIKYAEVTGE